MFIQRIPGAPVATFEAPEPQALSWAMLPLSRSWMKFKRPTAKPEQLTAYGMTAPDTRYSYPSEFTPQCSGS